MVSAEKRWAWCQLGAREDYLLPAELHRRGLLGELITDYWLRGASAIAPQALSVRNNRGLPNALVKSANLVGVAGEVSRRFRLDGWSRIESRNRWFGVWAAKQVGKGCVDQVFAYSYAALEIAEHCRALGMPFVLGQIDGGPEEARLIAEEEAANPDLSLGLEQAPQSYWASWRQEIALSDRIVVNSEWSRKLLLEAGVSAYKLMVVPLAYAVPQVSIERSYPPRFTSSRPLRVLYLGQLVLRKGIARLFDAIRSLTTEPISFDLVGPIHIAIPDDIRSSNKVRIHGAVSKQEVGHWYRRADVFILPTLSDGFALVQLEALSHGLPVLASKHCAEVVREEVDGLLLAEPTGKCVADALIACLRAPRRLAAMAVNAPDGAARFRPSAVADIFLDGVREGRKDNAPSF